MSDPLWCVICERVVDISEMDALILKGGRGGRTTVIDPATEVAHVVLSARAPATKIKNAREGNQ